MVSLLSQQAAFTMSDHEKDEKDMYSASVKEAADLDSNYVLEVGDEAGFQRKANM